MMIPNPREGKSKVDSRPDLRVPDVEAGRDDDRLVEPSAELHDDLARAVVADDLELADVAWMHERRQ